MTTQLDSVFGPLAATILTRFGASATLHTPVVGVFDPTSGGHVTESTTPAQLAVRCAPPYEYRTEARGATPIPGCPQGALLTILSRQLLGSTKPVRGSMLKFADGRAFTVLAVFPLVSGDLVAAYALQLEGVGSTP